MPPATSERKLIFLHIPRTGGMTLQALLRRLYPGAYHFCRDPGAEHVRDLLARFDCVELHAGEFGGEMVFFNEQVMRPEHWAWLREYQLFVMLRDPVDQVISNFYYLTSMRDQLEPHYRRRNIPFPTDIRNWLESPLARNLQLAFLLGNLPVRSGEILAPHHVEHAIEMWEQLDVTVGLTERYDESLHVLEAVTGKRIPEGPVEVKNRNPDRAGAAGVSDETREFIRGAVALDIQLYRYAADRFEEQLRKAGPCTRAYCV